MNSGSSALRQSKRLPPAWRYALVLFGLIAIVALFYGEENWRGRHAWERYRQELIKRGEPVEPSSMIPPRVPDDQNFAMTPFLAPLFDFVPGSQHWRDTNALARVQNFPDQFNAAASAVKSPRTARLNSWVVAQLDLNAWYAALHKSTADTQAVSNNSNPAEAAEGVLRVLAQYDPVIEEFRAASRRPYSRFNLYYDNDDPAAVLLPHLAVLKRTTQLLQVRASAELAAGRTDPAFEDLKLMFYLNDSVRNEPILISLLVRISELQMTLQPVAEGLARHQWNEGQLAAIEERLSRFDFCSDAHRALEGERVLFGAGIIDYIRKAPNKFNVLQQLGGAPGQPASGFDPAAAAFALIPSGWLYLEKLNHHRMFEEHMIPVIDLQARRISPSTVQKFETHVNAVLGSRGLGVVLRHNFFMAMLLPAVSKAAQRTAYGQTATDEAMLACALERYRLARGSYPEALDALAPQFIGKVPHDLITGDPLKYHRTGDGQYILYSVGWNQTDDGGVVAQAKTGGSVVSEQGDWVWR